MRRFFVGVVAAVVAIGFSTISVSADGAATPFKASYTSTGTDLWTCSGAHVVNRVSIKDSETCVISGNTTGYVAGTFTSGTVCPAAFGPAVAGTTDCGNVPPFGLVFWLSDFNGHIATRWTMTITDNGDGTFTNDLVAYYSS